MATGKLKGTLKYSFWVWGGGGGAGGVAEARARGSSATSCPPPPCRTAYGWHLHLVVQLFDALPTALQSHSLKEWSACTFSRDMVLLPNGTTVTIKKICTDTTYQYISFIYSCLHINTRRLELDAISLLFRLIM